MNGKLKHRGQSSVEAESPVEFRNGIAKDDCNKRQWEFTEPKVDHADCTIDSNNSNIVMKLLDSAPYSSVSYILMFIDIYF